MVPEAVLRAVGEERRSAPEDVWEGELRRLEGIGAALESERAGEAFFAVDGLRGIYGGRLSGVVEAARRAAAMPPRVAVAPTRFAAFAAAGDGEEVVVAGSLGDFLDPLPVAALTPRLGLGEREAGVFVETLRRLGIGTVGRSPRWRRPGSPTASGPLGLRALALARGEDPPLARAGRTRSLAESSCRRGPPAASSSAPWSCSSTGSSPPPSASAGRCWRSASGPSSAAAAAGAPSRGWAGRPPRPGCCAGCWCRGSRSCRRRPARCAWGRSPSDRRRRPARALGAGQEGRRQRLGEAVREVRAARGRGAAQGPPGRPRLPGAGAPGDPDSVPAMSPPGTDLAEAAVRADGSRSPPRDGSRSRSTASRSRRSARSGSSRTAGGPEAPAPPLLRAGPRRRPRRGRLLRAAQRALVPAAGLSGP